MENIPTVAEPPKPARRRRGKIARLPDETRLRVNLMLSDGVTYAQVIARLGDDGKELNVDNVREWHSGGYEAWRKDRRWLDEMYAKLQFAKDVLKDHDSSPKIREASISVAVTQMFDLVADFEPISLINKLAEDPANYSRILTSLSKLAEAGLKYDRKHADDSRQASRKKSPNPAGWTPAQLHQYEEEFNLLRRPSQSAQAGATDRDLTGPNGSQRDSTGPK
jgi:hypothetical protein